MPKEPAVAEPDLEDLAYRLADNAIDTAKSLLRNVADLLELVTERPMAPEMAREVVKALARAESALDTLETNFPDLSQDEAEEIDNS